MRFVAELYDDPEGFVWAMFPWGVAGGPLEHDTGPDTWQTDTLKLIGEHSLDPSEALQLAVASGHGIGKTALIAWIILWFISTRPNPQIVVTANTKTQLESKTWRELAKWHKLMVVTSDWFNWTATKFYYVFEPEDWFASAIPWSENKPEAFQGTHERHVMMIFDEASTIPESVWDAAAGAMTTPGAFHIAFGNPTRNTGKFSECFGRMRHRWVTRQIDSRTCKMSNKVEINKWIEDYGEDSDFVRIKVRGEFPRAGFMQFISSELVEAAKGRHLMPDVYRHAAKIIGVDVARFGDDQTVFIRRQGLAATGLKKFRGLDTMRTASLVAQEIEDWKPDAVMVDTVGLGAGVADRLRQLGYGRLIIDVQAGVTAIDSNRYFNLRAEMWGKMRDWLKEGAAIPADLELVADLIGPEYGYDNKERIQLEKKDDMKKRGLASPDAGDALAGTFAAPVSAKPNAEDLLLRHLRRDITTDRYDVFQGKVV